MNTLIIPIPTTTVVGIPSLTDEEQQLAFQEQLLLDQEAYYQGSEY